MQIKNIKVGQLETNCYILSNGNGCVVIDPGDNYELIEKEKSSYSSGIEELVGDSIVRVSKTTFDFDNDGINEIMLKLYEEYILLHYYNGEVYGYVLPGYRQNNNWEIDGTSHGSSSASESSSTKYSFSGSELTSEKSNVTNINKDNLIEFVNYSK